jgi:hypothetical protein
MHTGASANFANEPQRCMTALPIECSPVYISSFFEFYYQYSVPKTGKHKIGGKIFALSRFFCFPKNPEV